MCLNYFWFFSVISILNTQIHGEIMNNSVELSTNKLVNIDNLSDESERVIYRDIKNHIEYNPGVGLPGNIIGKIPRVPSSFLQPPRIQRNDVYSSYNHKKFMIKKLKEIRVISTTPRARVEPEKLKVLTSFYIRDHAPVEQSEREEISKNETKKEEKRDGEERERISFHVHGHEGPGTYAFGYDTGHGNNRQFRYEERHKNGTVTGNYGYYDARGKLRKVHYTSHPSSGYKTLNK